MNETTAKAIVQSLRNAFNMKSYDEFAQYCNPNFKYISHFNGEFDWERNGIDSMNDHAMNVVLKIVPDWEIGEIQNFIFNDFEIWLMAKSTGTITGKADIGDYYDSNREPTFEKFSSLMTFILSIENEKVSLIKAYADVLDVFLKMRIVKFVEQTDIVSEYIKFIASEGMLYGDR
ncbi:MAG: hypothetical protein ACW99A_17660 [Candidatus Kariarchaeaceae archaeon]